MKLPKLGGSDAPSTWTTVATRAVWFIAAAWILVMALGAGLSIWTAAPSTCASCHEIAPYVDSWKTSPHAHVSCPSCHEPIRSWARLPETLVWRAQMLQRDVSAHRANPNASTLSTTGPAIRPIPDENCLECHDLSREVTLPKGLVMDHAKHVQRNRSCVSCHRTTAHPPSDVEKPLLMMEQCFTCHGSAPGSKAPATCTMCHPITFSQRPQSHSPKTTWLDKHGKAAKANQQPCAMCHKPSFCQDCHGMVMPHPADWAKGKPPAHASYAKKDTKVCVQCHGPQPNLCSMCHHKGDFNPANGPWASNHAPTVSERGIVFCMSCHAQLFCFDCHSKLPGAPAAATKP